MSAKSKPSIKDIKDLREIAAKIKRLTSVPRDQINPKEIAKTLEFLREKGKALNVPATKEILSTPIAPEKVERISRSITGLSTPVTHITPRPTSVKKLNILEPRAPPVKLLSKIQKNAKDYADKIADEIAEVKSISDNQQYLLDQINKVLEDLKVFSDMFGEYGVDTDEIRNFFENAEFPMTRSMITKVDPTTFPFYETKIEDHKMITNNIYELFQKYTGSYLSDIENKKKESDLGIGDVFYPLELDTSSPIRQKLHHVLDQMLQFFASRISHLPATEVPKPKAEPQIEEEKEKEGDGEGDIDILGGDYQRKSHYLRNNNRRRYFRGGADGDELEDLIDAINNGTIVIDETNAREIVELVNNYIAYIAEVIMNESEDAEFADELVEALKDVLPPEMAEEITQAQELSAENQRQNQRQAQKKIQQKARQQQETSRYLLDQAKYTLQLKNLINYKFGNVNDIDRQLFNYAKTIGLDDNAILALFLAQNRKDVEDILSVYNKQYYYSALMNILRFKKLSAELKFRNDYGIMSNDQIKILMTKQNIF